MSNRYANYYQSSGLYHVSLPLLMGTRLDVLLFGEDEAYLESIWDAMEKELLNLETMLNRFDRDSEVSKLNVDAQFEPVKVSETLWSILKDCRRYYELTNGFFDVTLSDFDKIDFFEESHCVRFGKKDLFLDFGGYAKGYALACVRRHISNAGISRALACFGSSSILAVGTHPFGDNWSIGIDDPFVGGQLMTIKLRDDSLSVSGNTPRNSQHIVNPHTSQYVSGQKMVAVVAENPVDAEVLTTAWVASGEKAEPQWMRCFDLKNIYLIKC